MSLATDQNSTADNEKTTEERIENLPQREGIFASGITWDAALAVLACCLTYNGYLFTLIMPGVVLSYINDDLGPSNNYPWISIVWNLAAASVVTIGGRLTDIFGRRWFMITGALLGMTGALVGALGTSIPQMITAGVIMGCGGGFQEIVFASVQEIVPNDRRLLVLGFVETSNLVANFSPLIATMFATRTALGWRSCYWFGFAFEGCSVLALWLWYRPPSFGTKHAGDGEGKLKLISELDYVGLALFTSGCVLILTALNWGGRDYDWSSAAVIVSLLLGTALLVALGFWEVYRPLKHPILPPKLFRRNRQFAVIIAVVFLNGMLYYSSNILWPRQAALFFAPKDDAVTSGLYTNIFNFGTCVSSAIVLGVVPHVGKERWQMATLLAVQTALIGSMATVGTEDKAQAIVTVLLISSTISPVSFLAFGMSSLALEDQNDLGVSQGVLGTARLIGGAIATAIYTAVQQNKFRELLPARAMEAAQKSGYSGDEQSLLQAASGNTETTYADIPGISNTTILAVSEAVKQVNARSFQLVYLVAVAFGGVCLITAFFTRNIPKNKKTKERAVVLENESQENTLEPKKRVV